MRLISFDIGIKNLAYCVFDISPDMHIQITEWKTVNLLDLDGESDGAPACVCNCVIESKKGKKKASASEASTNLCGKKAKYSKNGNAFFCETHAKSNKSYILPKKEHSLVYLKKQKLDALENIYGGTLLSLGSGGAPVPKMKKADYIDALTAHYAKICYDPVAVAKKQNAGEADLITIGRAIQRHLDGALDVSGITHVIIENQISTIATRMKTLQGMITQYFISKPNGEAMVIEYISSANKLKGLVSPPPKAGAGANEQTNPAKKGINPEYKKHKTDGVAIAKRFVGANESLGKWGEVFATKKKDDLADCFLQGIWYLKATNIISFTDNLEINIVF